MNSLNSADHFPIGNIAGSAAIFEGKKILLIKRADNLSNYPGCWTFPSGKIEETDLSIADTVIREVREEVGLDFIPYKKWGFYQSLYNGKRHIALIHLGEWSGSVKLQKEEASDWRFFTYKETLSLDLAYAYKDAISDLHESGLIE